MAAVISAVVVLVPIILATKIYDRRNERTNKWMNDWSLDWLILSLPQLLQTFLCLCCWCLGSRQHQILKGEQKIKKKLENKNLMEGENSLVDSLDIKTKILSFMFEFEHKQVQKVCGIIKPYKIILNLMILSY